MDHEVIVQDQVRKNICCWDYFLSNKVIEQSCVKSSDVCRFSFASPVLVRNNSFQGLRLSRGDSSFMFVVNVCLDIE